MWASGYQIIEEKNAAGESADMPKVPKAKVFVQSNALNTGSDGSSDKSFSY